jgi:hypothetical protein
LSASLVVAAARGARRRDDAALQLEVRRDVALGVYNPVVARAVRT